MIDKAAAGSSTHAMQLTLVIGSRNVSSWSFRPWLALRQGGVPFEQVVVALRRADSASRIAEWSPSGKVPVLLVDGSPIWDSLAICELAAELAPDLWPADPIARAHARSVSAEMHSGFAQLRTFLPMDFVARFAAPGRLLSGVARDVARIESLWSDCRQRYAAEGPFLFGRFSVADAMYAPVVSRFLTYGIELGMGASTYLATMQSLPAWAEWTAAAATEDDEPGPARTALTAWSAALPRDQTSVGVSNAGAAPAIADESPRSAGAPFMARARSLAGDSLQRPQAESARPRPSRPGEVKPIGDGIHRRR